MGVVGFMIVEGYSLLDAIYMTVITVSTVGFQEVQPLSKVGRLFTSFLIITTFGTFTYAVSVLTSVFVSGEYKHYYKQYTMKKQVNKLNNHIIVCGFGRNGSQAVKKLDTHNQKYIVGYKTSDGKYVINPHVDTLLLPHSKIFVLGNSQQISQLNNIFNVQ